MNFTQFKFPHGTRCAATIDRPKDIEELAGQLSDVGWSFEIEINPDTQLVHADCCDDDEALCNRICRNGTAVPAMIDSLVKEAHERWTALGKPRAKGSRASKVFYQL